MIMFRFKNLSIRNKLILFSLFTSGVALLVALIAILTGAFFASRTMTLDSMTSIARVIGTNCVAALAFDDANAANETLRAMVAEPQIEYSRVYKTDGSLFAQYYRDSKAAFGSVAGADASEDVKTVLTDSSFSDGGSYHRFTPKNLQVLTPIVLDRSMIGVVEVSAGLAALYKRLTAAALICLGILLASFLVATVVATLAQRGISGPISTLTRTMNRVSRDKDYSTRVERESQDELGMLFEGFNGMLAEIQSRDEKL